MAQQFGQNLTLTSDSVLTSFGFRPTYIRVDPTTLGGAWLNFAGATGAVATTASSGLGGSFHLTSGNPVSVVISNPEISGLSSGFTAVTSAGSTAVIRVMAFRI